MLHMAMKFTTHENSPGRFLFNEEGMHLVCVYVFFFERVAYYLFFFVFFFFFFFFSLLLLLIL
jgi:hypothetical protein